MYDKKEFHQFPYVEHTSKLLLLPRLAADTRRDKEIEGYIAIIQEAINKDKNKGWLLKSRANIDKVAPLKGLESVPELVSLWRIRDHWNRQGKNMEISKKWLNIVAEAAGHFYHGYTE
jgi:hypothetical protein